MNRLRVYFADNRNRPTLPIGALFSLFGSLVLEEGLEPSRLAAGSLKFPAYTISPFEHNANKVLRAFSRRRQLAHGQCSSSELQSTLNCQNEHGP